jgi:hypothetical protein
MRLGADDVKSRPAGFVERAWRLATQKFFDERDVSAEVAREGRGSGPPDPGGQRAASFLIQPSRPGV